jgi:hypothetical protein
MGKGATGAHRWQLIGPLLQYPVDVALDHRTWRTMVVRLYYFVIMAKQSGI